MRIVVAGASGVVGRWLIPMLVEAGHEVTALIRKQTAAAEFINLGVRPVQVDIFDREAVFKALREAQPQAVIHQLTALSDRDFAANSRIRVEGTRNLVDAALEAGARKMIAQSISWAYAPGVGPAIEDEWLDLEASMPRKTTIDGIHALESGAAEMPEHVILRYGLFYGPGTWYASNGLFADQVRQKEASATDGVSSFVHVKDAARAAHLALGWPSGPVNIVDNEPAAGTVWLPIYADALGAPAPVVQQGSNRGERGASNGKAYQYGWKPEYPSWREGFLGIRDE